MVDLTKPQQDQSGFSCQVHRVRMNFLVCPVLRKAWQGSGKREVEALIHVCMEANLPPLTDALQHRSKAGASWDVHTMNHSPAKYLILLP